MITNAQTTMAAALRCVKISMVDINVLVTTVTGFIATERLVFVSVLKFVWFIAVLLSNYVCSCSFEYVRAQ